LICNLDLLPANAGEAANASPLISGEEAAHGNDIERLSIDGIGYNGAVLKALSDDETGPQLTVYVPPKEQPPRHPELFQSDAFTLNEAGDEVRCPNGETTRTRYRDGKDHGSVYHFRASHRNAAIVRCAGNALRPATSRDAKSARTIFKRSTELPKNVRRPTSTTRFAKNIRPSRGNSMRPWHDGRRGRYRGRLRAKVQYLILAVVVNCKCIVRLLSAAPAAQPA